MKALYEVPAPAKLNLFLHVVGRRPDGYHLLQTAFVLIDWCDTLHFERRGDAMLERHDIGLALPPDDLCLRAARALQQASGTTSGADITVDKRLPAGAGMGGGSSDAATTLLALNRLWRLDWPLARLMPIGLALGADVPFFLGGTNAFVEGIGDVLTPIELPRQWLAVVKPAAGVETRSIFGSPMLVRDTGAVILAGFLADASVSHGFGTSLGTGSFGRNDLQPPAMSQCAEIAEAAGWLEARYGNSRMTGSGSAVFAGAGTGAEPTTSMPVDVPSGWVARMCRSLEQHPLRGFAEGR
jgi:4-diphosphocytidyl-2-C-methyl-D-erythritol kinase